MKLTIKNQTFDLTLEEVESLKSQLDNKLPTTWEECNNIVKSLFYVDYEGKVIVALETGDKNNVPTESHAKSVLAMCQLMTIAEALNRTYERKDDRFWMIYYDVNDEKLRADAYNTFLFVPVVFNSKELAEHAIKYFEQLFLDYFMIER